MDIVICTDNNYIMPSGVLFCSICENNKPENIIFHVIADQSFSDASRQALSDIIKKYDKEIRFYQIDPSIFASFPIGRKDQPIHITLAAYYRLYLTELLPKELNKVLYLDGDIIVRGSLKDLWNTDIENYAVGVIPDLHEGSISNYNRLRYSPTLGYFNSGVLLINLQYWRENNILNDFLSYAKENYKALKFHDQDILNFIFRNQKLRLPIKYNLQNEMLFKEPDISWEYENELNEAIQNPIILHFTSRLKPWNKECDHPYKNEFFKYQNLTQWKGMPVQNRYKPSLKRYIKKILQKLKLIKTTPNPFRNNLKLNQEG